MTFDPTIDDQPLEPMEPPVKPKKPVSYAELVVLAAVSMGLAGAIGLSMQQQGQLGHDVLDGYMQRTLEVSVKPVSDRAAIRLDSSMQESSRARIAEWLKYKEASQPVAVEVIAAGQRCPMNLRKDQLERILATGRLDPRTAKNAQVNMAALASICGKSVEEIETLRKGIGAATIGIAQPGPYSQVHDGFALGQLQGAPKQNRI